MEAWVARRAHVQARQTKGASSAAASACAAKRDTCVSESVAWRRERGVAGACRGRQQLRDQERHKLPDFWPLLQRGAALQGCSQACGCRVRMTAANAAIALVRQAAHAKHLRACALTLTQRACAAERAVPEHFAPEQAAA
jgi:hypothetical protein